MEVDLSVKPAKREYRGRAHRNPLAHRIESHPLHPSKFDWRTLLPAFEKSDGVVFCDIGCGFGGLLVELSTRLQSKCMVGIEIRPKAAAYTNDRITALRLKNPGQFDNACAICSNASYYLPHFFYKGQLEKVFVLYADPHFKKTNFKRRVINPATLRDLAYVMKPGGIVYTSTDVPALHDWNVKHFSDNPLFERLTDEEEEEEELTCLVRDGTDEAQKVAREGREADKRCALWRRIPDPT